MADDDDSAALSDVDEEPLPPPPASAHKTLPQAQAHPQPDAQAQQRLLDLAAELEEERRLRRAAEVSLAENESRFARLKAFAQDVLRKRDDLTAEAAASARSLAALQAESAASARSLAALQAASARSLAALQAESSTASSMLSSGFERISAKASPSSAPAPLPTSQKYSSGLPALAYGVLKRANDIVDDLLAQIDAANRDRDRAREQMEHRNYQIAIEVSELEASVASRSADCESLSKSLSQREAEISELRGKIAYLEGKLDTQRPVLAEQIGCASKLYDVLAEQIGCASKLYDEMREVVKLVDADAASTLSDSVFVWKETDVEESLKVSLEGTKLAYELAAMALEKVGACMDDKESKLRGLEDRVDELIKEKEHIGVLLRSALQATTSEVLKVAEDGLRQAGIEIGLDERKEHRPGSVEKDEVYTLAGALENTVKESQVKIIDLQHLVEALR